jgi:hypothetical protein
MDLTKSTWLAAAVAVFCASCAPVEWSPATAGGGAAPPNATSVEVLPEAPAPRPAGPRHRIEAAIQNVRRRDLLTTNGFWTVFHGILGLGPGVQLLNPQTGGRVNAVDYICAGGELRGLQFVPTKHGLDVVTTGLAGGGQGHQDQFVAEMAQWGMPPDRKFVVLGREYTFEDFIRHTQMRARVTANQELSWAIVILGQYRGTDVSWRNAFGERLHLHDLLRYELDAPIELAACGGTHRLFGLTWVYHLHLQKGGGTEGVWQAVADANVRYCNLAKKYQNPDGSFSTDFFRGPGHAADKQLRLNTTGHTFEWLALALPDAALKEPWMEAAANALALMILDLQGQPVEGGSLYHAVHGLLLYTARVYDSHTFGAPDVLIPLPPGWAKGKTL